jgi:vancomycin resistance protein YoaR
MTGLRLILGIGLVLIPASVFAYPATVTYTFEHHIFSINTANNPQWRLNQRVWYFNGLPAVPPPRFLSCGQDEIIDPGWTYEDRIAWSEPAIAETLATEISAKLDRPAGSVVIQRKISGSIVFDGYGLTGREVDSSQAARLTKTALEQGISLVVLPVNITQPKIDVQDQELRDAGIREVVTIGESVFAKSPVNRRHNIGVGVSRFNGVLIPKNGIFSFDQSLGPVNERTGYRKELVIQGETTLPDYGGGLCQVSTTAYRGPWEYGMPILQRKNHSYAVSYYSPQGTDATIFPPNTDLKFKNDTPGALLIQSFIDSTDQAYFIYYGTADRRRTEIFGPYITGRIRAPTEEKISYTTEIPVGEKRKAGERHDGMKAVWYRTIQYEGSGSVTQRVFSAYETRPLIYQVGVTPEDKAKLTSGDLSSTPSWLPSKP